LGSLSPQNARWMASSHVYEVPDIVDGVGGALFASSRIGREGGLGFLLGSGSGPGWRSCVATRRLCRSFIVCVSI
jgi:hypothetical protein